MTLGRSPNCQEQTVHSILKPAIQLADAEKYRLYITALQENTRLEQRLLATNVLAADNVQLIPEVRIDKLADFIAAQAQQRHIRPILFIKLMGGQPEKPIHLARQYLQRIDKSAGQRFM